MRIAYVIINANRHEGTSRAVLEVAERLIARHNVDLWARSYEANNRDGLSDSHTSLKRAEQQLGWRRISGPGRPEIADYLSFKKFVDHSLKSQQYDIIHSAGPNTAYADVYTIQTVHPIKVAQTLAVRKQSAAGLLRRLSWRLYDSAVIRGERQSYTSMGPRGPRAFLPVSLGTKRELMSAYPDLSDREKADLLGHRSHPFDPIQVIPNGADLDTFTPQQRYRYRAAIRDRYGFAPDDFVVVFSGGDWRRKGLDLLIRAIGLLRERRVRLLVVGDDRNGKETRDLVQQLSLSDLVTFAGFQKEIHRYYAAGDIFVFPTLYEAFSLSTIEAAASGLPVIMSDASGAVDLLGGGDCGAIVARDPSVIADKVMEYRRDPELLASHGRNARAKAERDFSWDGIASKTLAVYEQLIDYRKFLSTHPPVGKED
jgi:glycosyltransferase involved in cell wall biosynthesis